MKEFWLFAYETYYPSGGMNDFIGGYETIEEATEKYDKWANSEDRMDGKEYCHGHIVDGGFYVVKVFNDV